MTNPTTILEKAENIKDWIIDLRRQLHRHPELAFEEFKSSELVRKTLDELDIPYQAGIAETGVVATIGQANGACIALRADMDALPIREETQVSFKSELDGVMHACGHDCHTAMLLGAARILKSLESEIKGPVKLIFQPAEEQVSGAAKMCQQGVLDNPKVEKIFGLHVWPWLDTGLIGSRAGAFLLQALNCISKFLVKVVTQLCQMML